MNHNSSNLGRINQELARIWPEWTATRILGRGSFGAAYEIRRHIRSNLEKAALKVISVPQSEAELEQLRFQGMPHDAREDYFEKCVDEIQNEIVIMQKLVGNSHLVSYEDYAIRKRYGIGWDIYIRMELLTGLTDYMRVCSLDEQAILKMGMDISSGLIDCHKNGIIHRDIKPQNIFINDTGSFKLGDFGVSRSMPESQETLSFKGTLAYMAPEVFHMMWTDSRSDIYSLGMVLYQCLNDNRPPFVPYSFTPEDIEIARQRRFAGEKIPDPAYGSGKLRRIVRKSLAPRPEDRYQTAEDLYEALAKLAKNKRPAGVNAGFDNRKNMGERRREDKAAGTSADKGDDKDIRKSAAENNASDISETITLKKEKEEPRRAKKDSGPKKRNRAKSCDTQRYNVLLTPEEAYYGCTKMITHRGRQVAVIIKAGFKGESVKVSLEGETIFVDPIISDGVKRYNVTLTSEEALHGCTKMVTHRGRQIAVIIGAGYKEGSIKVSFEGETFYIDPLIRKIKRYTVTLTPEEAYYGCTKMITHRGRQVAVIIEPNHKEESINLSFEGESIVVDTIIKYW